MVVSVGVMVGVALVAHCEFAYEGAIGWLSRELVRTTSGGLIETVPDWAVWLLAVWSAC